MAEYRAIEGAAGEEDLLIIATVVRTLTIPPALDVGRAKVQVRTAGILYSLNGKIPIAEKLTTGSTLEVGNTLVVIGSEIAALRMVRSTATDADVHVRYERRIN